MSIEFNKVTWYSKLAAVIVLIVIIILAWYIVGEYRKVSLLQESVLTPSLSEKTVSTKGDVALAIGETAKFDRLEISLKAIVQDDLCPANVVCAQAEAVIAHVTLHALGKAEERNFSSTELPYRYNNYLISIVAVSPTPVSNGGIDSKNYIITFHITKILKV